jgi:hypothetical protein
MSHPNKSEPVPFFIVMTGAQIRVEIARAVSVAQVERERADKIALELGGGRAGQASRDLELRIESLTRFANFIDEQQTFKLDRKDLADLGIFRVTTCDHHGGGGTIV